MNLYTIKPTVRLMVGVLKNSQIRQSIVMAGEVVITNQESYESLKDGTFETLSVPFKKKVTKKEKIKK